jgi:hypothetical protein
VRFADIVLRQGHLSEQAIVEAVMTGVRPAHLDRCDVCATRAVDLGRWLDDTRAVGIEAADAAFPAERLAAQQAQIMRRLEQLDEPARVISFPRFTSRLEDRANGRRVAASWVAVAAAAGLVVGVIGGQVSARLARPAADATNAASETATPSGRTLDAALLLDDDDRQPLQLDPLGDITPRTIQARAGR